MKLKSLLLGSAAALIAVTGARAADAVVADPEPVEYVRVCDMYGAGFFYIPGTETCLRISGLVRVDYQYDKADVAAVTTFTPATATTNTATTTPARSSTASLSVRARVNFDSRSETDWGMLRAYARIQGTAGASADIPASFDEARIHLGGFSTGYGVLHWTGFHGFGHRGAENGGSYGYDQGIFYDYTYAANGFRVAAGIQDTDGTVTPNNSAENMDLYVGAGYAGSMGSVNASYVYDHLADEGAYKISANLTAIENFSVKAWYIGGDSGHRYVASGDYGYGVGAFYQVNSELNIYAGYSDEDGTDLGETVVGANWSPVSGLTLTAEGVFYENDNSRFLGRITRSW